MLPLDNIKIVDLSARAPGPFCTMALSDMGADVLVVEAPPELEIGPRLANAADPETEAAGNPLRRNKRSIVLNLKQPEAVEVLLALVKEADVFIEGARPGVAERLGISYEKLKSINPRLVYCSISGYGQDGPYRLLPGHDINYISFSGPLSLIGSSDGAPAIPYNLLADHAAGGLLSAMAILTALWARQRTGVGQYIDMSMMDGSLYLIAPAMGAFFSSGQVQRPGRMRLNGGFPDYQAYECRDGKYLSIGCLEAKFWRNLCTALGREDLIPIQQDPGRYSSVIGELRSIFKTRTRDEWFDFLAGKEIAVGKVNSVDEVPTDPQVQARGLIAEVKGPRGKPVRQVNVAARLEGTPGRIRFAGSPPGAHTREVLREMDYDQARIDDLYRSGAVR